MIRGPGGKCSAAINRQPLPISLAGFTGFYSDLEDGAIKGAHSAGVQDSNFPAVAKFLTSGVNDFTNKVEKNGFVALISRIPFIVWIAILLLGIKAALLLGFPWNF